MSTSAFFVFFVTVLVDDLHFERIEEANFALKIFHVNAFDRFRKFVGFSARERPKFFQLIVERIRQLDELTARELNGPVKFAAYAGCPDSPAAVVRLLREPRSCSASSSSPRPRFQKNVLKLPSGKNPDPPRVLRERLGLMFGGMTIILSLRNFTT